MPVGRMREKSLCQGAGGSACFGGTSPRSCLRMRKNCPEKRGGPLTLTPCQGGLWRRGEARGKRGKRNGNTATMRTTGHGRGMWRGTFCPRFGGGSVLLRRLLGAPGRGEGATWVVESGGGGNAGGNAGARAVRSVARPAVVCVRGDGRNPPEITERHPATTPLNE